MKRKPCDDCPWRRDAPPAYWDPQHFKDIWANCQDDGTHAMLCHKSKPDAPIYCAGHIIVVGYDSIGVRIAALTGKISPEEYGSDDPLYDSFAEMMTAQGIALPRRNRWK